MYHYSEYKRKLNSLIGDSINNRIYYIVDSANIKDTLNYSLCLSEAERNKYTNEVIYELQQKLKSCKTSEAIILTALITNDQPGNLSFEERKILIIENYFLSEYSEVLDYLTESENSLDLNTIDVNYYINHLGLDVERLEKFIINIANAERYIGMLSLLNHKKDISNETLSKLEKDISLIISTAQAITPDSIKAQLEPLINSSKDLDVIDKAVKSVLDETYKKFRKLGDSLYNNLDKLKALSQENYLIGFASVYEKLNDFSIKDKFNDSEDSLSYFYNDRHKDPYFYCLLSIKSMVYKGVLKVISDELLINRLADYDAAFKLPTSFNDTIEYINKGFYELESIMEGKVIKMKYFNIPRAIEKFNSLRNKYENKPKESLLLLDKYFDISQQIYNQIDQGEFDNDDAFEDEIFMKTWNELSFFYDNMQSLFTQAEIDYLAPTGATKVLDILNPLNVPQAEQVQVIKTKIETSIHFAFTYSKKLPKDKNNLTEFRKSLIDGGFIDKSTKLADFNKVFKNERITAPIIWSGNLSELYYLIKTLHNDKKLIDNTGKEVWKITANCFVDSSSNQFDWSKFRGQKQPVNTKKLDKIISVL